ncbi:acyl-homoserine-lactone synthase [Bosea vaviloviae]|uniref:Acyl-homoserine-lactone synthase n=1 Tax=Bosea vaviloviae TaxID=1526658 RepID=A0A1D7UCL8_9HYPH|nr:acyl-homoserine-lactone synthase [Bosea vaviloviae]AOO85118.1 conjugal transfer protein TraI [Bosea vaviloviae]
MQVIEISRAVYGANFKLLMGMHRLRRKVFKDRLDWSVSTTGDLEIDQYDTLGASYLVIVDNGDVLGCVRLLPTTGPNMLADTFPELLDGTTAPRSDKIAESSRFCVDTELSDSTSDGGLRRATLMLLAAMREWGEARGLASIATVTDLRMERILRRANWLLTRLGSPRRIGSTMAVAGLLPIQEAPSKCWTSAVAREQDHHMGQTA